MTTTIRTAEQAAEVARKTTTNIEGTCQKVTRGYYLAPSAGDRDGDGDADAYDGWLSETQKVPGDRRPPLGFPVSFRSKDRSRHGHRAISLGDANGDGVFLIRSTDFDTATKRYRAGVVGTGTIDEVAAAMNCDYLGWSKTIDGVVIPTAAPVPKPTPKPETAPLAHRHLVNTWNDSREVSLHDVSAVQLTGKQPYAKAANVLHDAIEAAFVVYYKATGVKP